MTGTKKIICAATVVALVASLSTMGVMAASYSTKAYDTTSGQYCASMVNDTGSARGISINTRPTTTTSNVTVDLTRSDGTVVQSSIFPWQVSIHDWRPSIPSGEVRRIYVRPTTAGQWVKGTLYYNWN